MEAQEKGLAIKDFFNILKRHYRLIIIFTLSITLISWYISSFVITPIYQASTEILVNKLEGEQGYSYNLNDINTDLKFISTYNVIIKSPRITNLVIDEYNLDLTSDELIKKITIDTVTDSQVMKITVEDTDYAEATQIANAVASIFQREIVKIMKIDNVQILTMAMPKENPKPVSPDIPLITILSFLAALTLSIGISLIIDFTYDTLKNEEEIEQITGYVVLGGISKIKLSNQEKGILVRILVNKRVRVNKAKNNITKLITLANNKSPINEEFKTLRNNIQFANSGRQINTIMFTSAGPKEGKSTIISNLAVVLAQTDKKVLLVDADFLRPTIHEIFYLENKIGLTTLFNGIEKLQEAIHVTNVPYLSVLTSGPPPINSSQEESKKILDILTLLSKQFDYILVDAPPIISDSQILSQYVKGVIFVIKRGKTKQKAVKKAMKQLEKAKANVIGIVINNKDYKDESGVYYYYNKH